MSARPSPENPAAPPSLPPCASWASHPPRAASRSSNAFISSTLDRRFHPLIPRALRRPYARHGHGFVAQADEGERVERDDRRAHVAHERIHVHGADLGAVVPGQTPPSADDLFTLYANGTLVGSARTTADLWKSALLPFCTSTSITTGAPDRPYVVPYRCTNAPATELGWDFYGRSRGPWHGDPVLRLMLSLVHTDYRLVIDGHWKVMEAGPTRWTTSLAGKTTTVVRASRCFELNAPELPPKGTLERPPAAEARRREPHPRVHYGAGVGVRVPDPLLGFRYQSEHRNLSEGSPLTCGRSLRARELASRAVVVAVERVIAGWVSLAVLSSTTQTTPSGAVIGSRERAPDVFEPEFLYVRTNLKHVQDLQGALADSLPTVTAPDSNRGKNNQAHPWQ
ncbi:hypothetical protein DFH09DRAFT_1368419 [Mycena vulgaris]|nr:hypothetical protein DFH09DRAFT_1368419 [Mycena vulgaris]